MKSIFVFQFDVNNNLTTDAQNLKFGTEIDHKYTYKFYLIIINKHKHGSGANFEIIFDRFNIDKICTS
jgi:hypothetical protein